MAAIHKLHSFTSKQTISRKRLWSIFKLSGQIIFISVMIQNGSVRAELNPHKPASLSPYTQTSLFSWRTEGIEKLKSLEGKSNIFLLAIEWFLLERLLRDTYVQRGSKHRGSASSGVRGIFSYTIYTHLRTVPDKPEGISQATGEGLHTTKRWKRKELEGCCAPLSLEGKVHTADAAPFCFGSFQDEN